MISVAYLLLQDVGLKVLYMICGASIVGTAGRTSSESFRSPAYSTAPCYHMMCYMLPYMMCRYVHTAVHGTVC